jgi:ATP-dependent DNA ligase
VAVRPSALFYYVFDVMVLAGVDVTTEPLTVRRELLQERVLGTLDEPTRESPVLVRGDPPGSGRQRESAGP